MNIRRFTIVPATLLLMAGCAGTTEQARTIERLNTRIIDLQSSLYETGSKVEELDNKFILLLEKIEADRERVEVLRHDAEVPPEGLKVVRLEEELPVRAKPEPGQAPVKKAKKVTEGPDALYSRAQDLFLTGRYEEARRVFKAMVRVHPEHGLADNALYWTGESYYTKKDFSKALETFKDLVERYPKGNKAPDALLKIGFSYLELQKKDEAKAALLTLLRRYPGSEAAFKAEKRLKGL